MALGVGRRERRLADAAQPMQGCDRDPALVAFQRRVDRFERVVAAEEVPRDADRDVRDRDRLGGFGLSGRRRHRLALGLGSQVKGMDFSHSRAEALCEVFHKFGVG